MTVTVTADTTIPDDTGLELTVYEDLTGKSPRTADNTQTLPLSDGDHTYTYNELSGKGRRYWWRVTFDNGSDEGYISETWDVTPALHSVEIDPSPAVDPIGYTTIKSDGETYRVPAYPRGTPNPDVFHGTTDDGVPASLNTVPPEDSPIRAKAAGQVFGIATEDLLVGPEPQPPEEPPPTIIDDFERVCLYDFYGPISKFVLALIKAKRSDDYRGHRGLKIGHALRNRRVFCPPGKKRPNGRGRGVGLGYYPQAGDTITWDLYSEEGTSTAIGVYFGGESIDSCYGLELHDEALWLYVRRNGEFHRELRYGEYIRPIDCGWTRHTLAWDYDPAMDQVTLDYEITRHSDGETVGALMATDEQAMFTEGGWGYGVFPGNDETWLDYVRVEPGDRHDQ